MSKKSNIMPVKHIHRYERRRLGAWKKKGHEIYKCSTPGCTHYLVDMESVIGRYSLCWGLEGPGSCKNQVEMTRHLVFTEKRKRPLCEECKEKKKELQAKMREMMSDATIDAGSASE